MTRPPVPYAALQSLGRIRPPMRIRASTMQMPSMANLALRQAPMQRRRAGLPGSASALPRLPMPMASSAPAIGMGGGDVGKGGTLSAKARQKLPSKDFALPGKGEGKQGKGSGSYPIPDRGHAQAALSRVAQHGTPAEKATVRAKVKAKFGMGGGKGKPVGKGGPKGHPVGCGCGNHGK